MPDCRKEVVSLPLFTVGCSLQNLPASSELIWKMGWEMFTLSPPASSLQTGVSWGESEHRYSGSATVLTIGMIKQIVYLFYSHLLHPRLQKSFVCRCRQERNFPQSQKLVMGKKTRASLRWKRMKAALSFHFLTGFLVTLNWLFSALIGLECLLNSRPEKRLELQHEKLGQTSEGLPG